MDEPIKKIIADAGLSCHYYTLKETFISFRYFSGGFSEDSPGPYIVSFDAAQEDADLRAPVSSRPDANPAIKPAR